MGDASLTTTLGRILVTGGSGFVGANLVTTLLNRGYEVRSFDRAPSPLPAHPRLQVLQGDICDPEAVAAAVAGIDTVFHTAAVIDLMGGASVTEEYRRRSHAVNVTGTENLVRAARAAGVQRFVYTSSNSVVMSGRHIAGGDETLPYTERFNDLYTETKVIAEKFVLSQNGVDGMLTCSIRPSGIWGPGDQTMFRKMFESLLAGHVKVLVGGRKARLDNSYVHNLVHGFILAAEHLVPGGTAPGQAYFINDGEPVNMFEFARPVVEACGRRWPRIRVPGRLVWLAMTAWQWLHFRFGLPKPMLEPLRVERLLLDNYFSIDKARRELGYRPRYTTEQAMAECLPYYVELFRQLQHQAEPVGAAR
ncbi:3 beta-hydroxysteroid dehydrogenase/Delta 5--_4-isomerase [Mycolicibacterium hassiacum DSM 44199]|uniref:3 beta-hydroxysteroid dehydrogenase/Delta 5-->4-isomerase n=1 Tax=Mycolicibacterium hassiacum (strain DSM 44199 / CIP 105218 / JCM 12690 / 3849) TaxID=1122247 RepID=K5BET4_MYCHD|nr:NAD-dependent epimerase/dehydratase family protein [Mycolicibacterium hassiacum]EKF22591.1 3 beta-hydroxysteroid dehydrogenase/Delta 5-->4-isomerase [Mycolicibacterium hassiacum DSM 44199]MBX5485516.1 NAD-dependent epimerase/dehydratase family protein [Mycolicibacterium hassiacum]MDA4088768.1 steroid delta-isomerase [Mycolicibacterium hassiacum DSM 44199]VCT91498.1 3 beta-hydroxysteroid dehydrogenase/Delta 5-->4-isomerase [Mycolicibacterium hassiacum DSM 44199]